jgi:hypothetical protein
LCPGEGNVSDFCKVVSWYAKAFRLVTCDPKPVLLDWYTDREKADKMAKKLNLAAKRWMKRERD